MRYLKLAGVEFKNPTQAIEAAKSLMIFGPSVSCYHRRTPGGDRWQKEVIWTIQVPAGNNAAGLIKHLKGAYPLSEWKLFEIDEDGYEIDLQPSVQPKTDPSLIPVKASA
jgi:hypothetical protein